MLTTLIALATLSAPPDATVQADKPRPNQPVAAAPSGGLWLPAALSKLVLVRWADEVAHHYDMGDDQRNRLRDAVVRRWIPFLQKNRLAIQPLINDLFEMKLGLDPPPRERIRAWAADALPLLDELRRQIDDGGVEFVEMLTPGQRTKYRVEALGLNVGLEAARRRLINWRDGDFDPATLREFWIPTAAERASGRAARDDRAAGEDFASSQDHAGPPSTPWEGRGSRRATAASGAGADNTPAEPPTDQIALELEAWSKYVADFIKTNRLDDAQTVAAMSCLRELKQRALTHRDLHRIEIQRLESRIPRFDGSPDELARIKKQLTELYGPVDAMFTELKRRLDQIPTANQRAAAKKAASTNPPSPTKTAAVDRAAPDGPPTDLAATGKARTPTEIPGVAALVVSSTTIKITKATTGNTRPLMLLVDGRAVSEATLSVGDAFVIGDGRHASSFYQLIEIERGRAVLTVNERFDATSFADGIKDSRTTLRIAPYSRK
ncbi:MAG: hypothetical protein ACE5EX_04955 [Phycisphaerae bacterium]